MAYGVVVSTAAIEVRIQAVPEKFDITNLYIDVTRLRVDLRVCVCVNVALS